jgi:lysophospholipase L1-like esterase
VTSRLVALGDSFSCGEGVGLRMPQEQTWVGRLAGALSVELTCLARPGATVSAVRRLQQPAAEQADPAFVTLLIGLNDVSRGGFSAAAFREDLFAIVTQVGTSQTRLLLARLHDPCEQLPFARPLRAWIGRRIGAVNAAVDAVAARDPRVVVLDLNAVPGLRLRTAWSVDRLHPSEFGHAVIAIAAAEQLGAPTPPALAPVSASRRPQEAIWLVRHALPWTVSKSVPVGRFVVRRALS